MRTKSVLRGGFIFGLVVIGLVCGQPYASAQTLDQKAALSLPLLRRSHAAKPPANSSMDWRSVAIERELQNYLYGTALPAIQS